MQKNTANHLPKDWHRADVVAALKKLGWSVARLAQEHQLSRTTLYTALDRPYPKGERIIADALGLRPEEIWPEREAKRNFKPVLQRTHGA